MNRSKMVSTLGYTFMIVVLVVMITFLSWHTFQSRNVKTEDDLVIYFPEGGSDLIIPIKGTEKKCELSGEWVLRQIEDKDKYVLCRVEKNNQKFWGSCPVNTETVIKKEDFDSWKRMAIFQMQRLAEEARRKEAEKLFD